jgi:hypothetical protein
MKRPTETHVQLRAWWAGDYKAFKNEVELTNEY